jgi:acyl carrier protein
MASEQEVYEALADIFADVFMRDDLVLSPTLTAADVAGWDSFKQIEILLATEEHFGIKFNSREIDALKSLGDLATLVVAKAK